MHHVHRPGKVLIPEDADIEDKWAALLCLVGYMVSVSFGFLWAMSCHQHVMVGLKSLDNKAIYWGHSEVKLGTGLRCFG